MRLAWLWAAFALVLGAELPGWGSLAAGGLAGWLAWKRRWAWRPLALVLCAGLAGIVSSLAGRAWEGALPAIPETPLEGTAEVVDLAGDGVRVVVRPDATPAHLVRVRLDERPRGLAPGARVLVTRKLRRPDPADNPGTLDFRAWCARRRIAFVGSGGLELVWPAGPFTEGLVEVRAAARAAVAEARPAEGAALLTGLLLGDQSLMPGWAVRAFEATGTGHLLSVSGVHISGLALLAYLLGVFLGRRLGLARPEIPGALLALPASAVFVALAQFPLAGLRSGLMVALVLLGRLLARRGDGRNVLGLAALLVLADDPGLAREPSFQLSFGAVLALVLFAGQGSGLPGLVRASLVASLFTLPVQCAHFGTVAPLAPLANLLVIPMASAVVVPLGLGALALHGLWPGAMDLAAEGALGLGALVEVLASVCRLWVPGAWAALLLGVPFAVWAVWSWSGPRLALAAAAALVPAGLWLRPPPDTVDFLAVGQGDAILLRSAGRALLVDAGPDPSATVLRAYLRHVGVARLDAVAITHAHPDHFGGLVALAGAVEIGALWTNGHLGEGPEGADMRAALQRAGLRATGPPAGPVRWGDLWLTFLNAPPPAVEGEGENDASLVLRVSGPGGAVLLPGDIEAGAENRLGPAVAALGPVDVLKAPHHGSRTSSTPRFLNLVRPRAVVFTVGRENRFHFPRPQVQARYAAREIAQWQTDTDGAVRLVLDEDGPVMEAHHRREARMLGPEG